MPRFLLLLLPLLLVACGGGFQVPRSEYRQQVRTLGVLPLLVDEASVVVHPLRDEVLDLLRRHSVGKEERLVEAVREEKGHFDVRPLAGAPRALFGAVVAAAPDRRYRFHPAAVAELAEEGVVDALLVVILHGETRAGKRWDRRHLSYLEVPYDDIRAYAAVVLPSGETVWELPGGDEPFLALQYPDFDEAFYNRAEEVRVKYITPAGLERTLAEPLPGLFGRSTFPGRYRKLFEDIASALRPGWLNPLASPGGEG